MENKEQQEVKVEYIVIMSNQNDNSMGVKQFESLLHTSSNIKLKKDKVEYKTATFGFNICQNKMPDTSSCFDLTFTSTTEESNIKLFKDLLKEVRGICNRFNGNNNSNIIELYNSLGAYYCEKAYRIIYELENLMRKLIYKFMIVNVGVNWHKTDVPKEVNDSIKKENKQSEEGFLHKLDFIQLSNLLFQKYSNNNIEDFFKSIKDKKGTDTITVDEIKKYQKKSNWQKYFAKNVECEAEQLAKRWEEIYNIRCQVAHCRILTEEQFNNLTQLNKVVKKTIESALETIDAIKIEEEEREQVAENISSINDSNIANFLRAYNNFSRRIGFKFNLSYYDIHQLRRLNLINTSDYNKLLIIREFRNRLVHNVGIPNIDTYIITKYINTLEEVYNRIESTDMSGKTATNNN